MIFGLNKLPCNFVDSQKSGYTRLSELRGGSDINSGIGHYKNRIGHSWSSSRSKLNSDWSDEFTITVEREIFPSAHPKAFSQSNSGSHHSSLQERAS